MTNQYAMSNYDGLLANTTEMIVKSGVIKSGAGALKRGRVLGRILLTAGAPVAGGANTGNGTCTGVALGAGVKQGTYTLACTGGSMAASVTAGAGAGKGTMTLDATTPLLAGAQIGVYQAVCVAAADNAGTFFVYDPNGIYLGAHTVGGAAFASQIKFAIADGGTDFAVGDVIKVTVAPAVPANGLATFSVTDPDGVALAAATVGTAYNGAIKFTLNDGTQNFAIGDTVTIAVSAAATAKWTGADKDHADGSQYVDAILLTDVDASEADAVGLIALRGEFNSHKLIFATGDTLAEHEQTMRNKGLVVKSNVIAAPTF